ncbi:cellulase family glycosylhydrolase [Planctomycetota bacterium]|nr:cellulase family glycosylhydrolase [Planctomycetota bacterium]
MKLRSVYPSLLTLLICTLLVTSSAFAQNKNSIDPAKFHGINAGAPIWDGEIELTPRKIRQIAATGTRAIRFNFRHDGVKKWTPELLDRYEEVIDLLLEYDFEILGLLCNDCTHGWFHQWNDTSEGLYNQYTQDFVHNAQVIVSRFHTKIKTWEIWNEPDAINPQNKGGTYIPPAVFARMLLETRIAIVEALPQYMDSDELKIVVGGFFAHDIDGRTHTSAGYLRELYEQKDVWEMCLNELGRQYPWDILGYHFYIDQYTNLNAKKLNFFIDDFVAVRDEYDDENSKLLITEFGWHTVNKTQELQRDNAALCYDILAAREEVIGTYWYQWVDEIVEKRGMVFDDARNPKELLKEFRKRCQQTIKNKK